MGSEVNGMTLVYAAKLGFTTQKISVGAQKIDGLPLRTYAIALTKFSIRDSLERAYFFEETFLLAVTSIKMVLEMFFLIFSNADFKFSTEKLIWKSYITTEALSTISWVKLINKREFAKIALNKNSETFVIYVIA